MNSAKNWILVNKQVQNLASYPDVVHFEMGVAPGTNALVYTVTQFASNYLYSHVLSIDEEKRDSYYHYPACVVRLTDTEIVRCLWSTFVQQGWERMVNNSCAEEVLAREALAARWYRAALLEKTAITTSGVFSGRYEHSVFTGTPQELRCDPLSCLYFPNKYPDPLTTAIHPVTNMPYVPVRVATQKTTAATP